MARGGTGDEPARAMELTKWFDTNYHYLVPEFSADQTFRLASDKPLRRAGRSSGRRRPGQAGAARTDHLPSLREDDRRRRDCLSALPAGGAVAGLCRGHPAAGRLVARSGSRSTNQPWCSISPRINSPPSSGPTPFLAKRRVPPSCYCRPPMAMSARPIRRSRPCRSTAIGLDFVRGPANLDFITQHGFPADKWLVAGVVDGRNVWTNDLAASLDLLGRIQEHVPSRAVDDLRPPARSSTSPMTSGWKTILPAEVRPWLAFADRSWPRS